ncbi:MAG: cytochrome c oxidase subunit II [Mycobacteriales bacterium]
MRRHQKFGRRVRLMAAAGALLGTSACTVPRFSFPRPRSLQAEAILKLWQGAFIAAAIIGAFVVGLIVWCVFRYRAKPGDDTMPVQTEYVVPLEIAYTAIPVVIIAVLAGFTYATQLSVEKRADTPLVIEVQGSQWQWQFRYPESNVAIIGGTIAPDGESAPTLVLPVSQPVRIVLTSADVVHAFWVPDFLFKKDNVPGRTNEFDVTATEVGEYVGRCAEFCGLEHARMTFRVRVVPAADLGSALTAAGAK